MTHKDSYEDWKYLFKEVGVADDMTGGYVDQEDLDRLLKNPTKKMATSCLESQIYYWFKKGIEYTPKHVGKNVYDLIDDYPRIEEIARKRGIGLDGCPKRFVGSY